VLCAANAALVRAQTDDMRFEVVSIKPSTGRANPIVRPPHVEGATFISNRWPLVVLVPQAYGIRGDELYGAPDWLMNDLFDVAARIPDDRSARDVPAMLQSLLTERLAIRVHRETRERPVYTLSLQTTGSLGPNFKSVEDECKASCGGRFRFADAYSGGYFTARGASWASIFNYIERAVPARIVDRTALTGAFDVNLTYAGDLSASAETSPDIVQAIRQQLGLRVERKEQTIEVVVIDHVERPTPN
jgi:uncharacterized protein (TIGR03435 family)